MTVTTVDYLAFIGLSLTLLLRANALPPQAKEHHLNPRTTIRDSLWDESITVSRLNMRDTIGTNPVLLALTGIETQDDVTDRFDLYWLHQQVFIEMNSGVQPGLGIGPGTHRRTVGRATMDIVCLPRSLQ